MKAHLLIPVLLAGLVLSGCNIYYADQATKRGVQAYSTARQAQDSGDFQTANTYYLQAQREFQTAVDHDTTGTDRHYNLGRVSQDLKQYEAAIREYDLAIRYFPGNGKAHSGKIDSLVKMRASQDQIDQAINTAVGIVKLDPGRIYLTLAMAYYQVGRIAEMPEVLAKAAQASPTDPYIQAVVGRYYHAIGNTPLGIRHLMMAYELNPDQPGVAYDLGRLGQTLPPTPMPGGE